MGFRDPSLGGYPGAYKPDKLPRSEFERQQLLDQGRRFRFNLDEFNKRFDIQKARIPKNIVLPATQSVPTVEAGELSYRPIPLKVRIALGLAGLGMRIAANANPLILTLQAGQIGYQLYQFAREGSAVTAAYPGFHMGNRRLNMEGYEWWDGVEARDLSVSISEFCNLYRGTNMGVLSLGDHDTYGHPNLDSGFYTMVEQGPLFYKDTEELVVIGNIVFTGQPMSTDYPEMGMEVQFERHGVMWKRDFTKPDASFSRPFIPASANAWSEGGSMELPYSALPYRTETDWDMPGRTVGPRSPRLAQVSAVKAVAAAATGGSGFPTTPVAYEVGKGFVPPGATPSRPPLGEKQKKLMVISANRLINSPGIKLLGAKIGYGAITEMAEFIDILYSNLPRNSQKVKRNGKMVQVGNPLMGEKLKAVWLGLGKIKDWDKVGQDLIWNEIEDRYYGMQGKAAAKGSRDMGMSHGIQLGVAFDGIKGAPRTATPLDEARGWLKRNIKGFK